MRHDLWSSVSAKYGYVKDSLASLVSVSKALGFQLFCLMVFCSSYTCPGRPIWGKLARGKVLALEYAAMTFSSFSSLEAGGREERFFAQLLFHDPVSISLCYF